MSAICVICKIDLVEVDTNLFRCSKCKREYIGDYEIMATDPEIGTAHDEEAATIEMEGIAAMSGPRLETKNDELDFSNEIKEKEEDPKTRSDIKIPKYLKDSETTKVVEYHGEE